MEQNSAVQSLEQCSKGGSTRSDIWWLSQSAAGPQGREPGGRSGLHCALGVRLCNVLPDAAIASYDSYMPWCT